MAKIQTGGEQLAPPSGAGGLKQAGGERGLGGEPQSHRSQAITPFLHQPLHPEREPSSGEPVESKGGCYVTDLTPCQNW